MTPTPGLPVRLRDSGEAAVIVRVDRARDLAVIASDAWRIRERVVSLRDIEPASNWPDPPMAA